MRLMPCARRSVFPLGAARLLALGAGLASALSAQAVRPADRDAERAQRDFERFRHQHLPVTYGDHAPCQELVGRFCYWLDGAAEVPAEAPGVPKARGELLAALATAQLRRPDDAWIVGQRVRYLIEAGAADSAITVARTCSAEGWWCAALRGTALHEAERIGEASAAFDTALALAPTPVRCKYTDVSPWLEHGPREQFTRLPCTGEPGPRDSIAADLWRQADPFGGRETNEARVIFLSRRTYAMLLESSTRPDLTRWGDDMEELGMRYGFATRWAATQSANPTDPFPSIVEHEPQHATPFAPGGHAIARFRVAGADSILDISPRAARFRRGDSLLVVVAYDVSELAGAGRDSARVRVAASLVHGERAADVHAVTDRPIGAGRFALRARNTSGTLFVEALDSAARRAVRGRATVEAIADSAGLSDLILVSAEHVRGRADVRLDSIIDAVDTRATIPVGEPLGLYWEAYRAPTEGDSLRVELRIVPTNISLAARFAAALRLRELPEPQTIVWANPARTDAGDGHTLVVETSAMPPGVYRLELWLRGRGPDAVATTEVRLTR